jgi:hypothetical protein
MPPVSPSRARRRRRPTAAWPASASCVVELDDLAEATKVTFDAAVASCAELPPFGVAPTVDEGVRDAVVTHVRGLVTDALASSPGGAMIADATDARGRRCQAPS